MTWAGPTPRRSRNIRPVGASGSVTSCDVLHALTAEASEDRLAEPVGADPTDEGHRMPEPREPDHDVRLRPGDEAVEGGRLRERAR